MKRCRICLYPATKPDLHFDESGQCSACTSHAKRKLIDWGSREADLRQLLDRHQGRCIVPSSGGKDSTWQVLKLLELGADVTIVTATTCHLTEIGRKNIDNLARYATTYEISPNKVTRAKLNRLGLEMVGDISWPEHCAIFTTPFRMAAALGIPLVFYGECPQEAYGGPQGSDEARQMTRRWISEFGGFLGLRPADLVGVEGITERDMLDYQLPKDLESAGIEAHFLGQYFEWDSHRNAEVAAKAGMIQKAPSSAAWWWHENLDNAQTGLHDYMGYLKYSYGRACAQISVDVRNGKLTRDKGLPHICAIEGILPLEYGGVHINEMLAPLGLELETLLPIMDRFTNGKWFKPRKEGHIYPELSDTWYCD